MLPNWLIKQIQAGHVYSLHVYDLSCLSEDGEETLDTDLYPDQLFSNVPVGRGDRIVLRSKDGDIGKALTFEVKFVEHDMRADTIARNQLRLELMQPCA